jgi:hypothetical protein
VNVESQSWIINSTFTKGKATAMEQLTKTLKSQLIMKSKNASRTTTVDQSYNKAA